MRRRFITSDTHLGHKNILTYCPWRKTWAGSIEEHDRKLIEAWNAVVTDADLVIHCGDFALVKKPQLAEIRRQLNGAIMLVLGNHDRSATSMQAAGFDVCKSWVEEIDGNVVMMRHDPNEYTAEEADNAAVLLHGHWHGDDHRSSAGIVEACRPKLVDVGIDARKDIAPAQLDDLVRGILATRS